MSEILERWKGLTEAFGQRLDAVSDDQWDSATPCADFTVRQLVEHAIDVQRVAPKGLGATGAIDTPHGDNPKATWQAVRAAALDACSAEGALEKEMDTPIGKMPVGQFFGGPACGDILIHTWDLARAIGADEKLPEEACQAALAFLQAAPAEFLRQPGRFDNAIEPPEGADIQTQMLCFTGRQP
ncbi:TIGR03086 family metal-binding protein [Candidatus Entotheonella palauensis]|uniref:TIGR03086 family metal-binding protein n=1 Tax=Candidatus Entotheonella palauensis TaxID=93172 RepID=UPI0015C49004|nr:TIGR03086 family metal-binding protein [Candidatus Entotheonella palauensis]